MARPDFSSSRSLASAAPSHCLLHSPDGALPMAKKNVRAKPAKRKSAIRKAKLVSAAPPLFAHRRLVHGFLIRLPKVRLGNTGIRAARINGGRARRTAGDASGRCQARRPGRRRDVPLSRARRASPMPLRAASRAGRSPASTCVLARSGSEAVGARKPCGRKLQIGMQKAVRTPSLPAPHVAGQSDARAISAEGRKNGRRFDPGRIPRSFRPRATARGQKALLRFRTCRIASSRC